jgi:HK97 family phage major capsid protein
VLVAEGAQLSESQPVFAQASLPVYKYGLTIQITRELVEDTSVDLLGYLARQAGRAVGNAFGTHAITGDGSSKPYGVVTQATVGVTGATSVTGAASASNLIDLYHSVIQPYRNSPSCGWLMRDASVGAIRKLTDVTSGQFLWQPGLQASQPDMLLGKPLRTDPNVAAAATSAKSILFGDFSPYFVRIASGIRFERSDDFAFDYDLTTFRCLARMGGVLTDTSGCLKFFIGGAS